MNLLKEVVLRKYNEFFINLKNDKFKPHLFYDALSLANGYVKDNKLTRREMLVRQLLLEGYTWQTLKESYFYEVEPENKTELRKIVSSNRTVKAIPFISVLQSCISDDQQILDSVFKIFKIDKKEKAKEITYKDINTKWSVAIAQSGVGK